MLPSDVFIGGEVSIIKTRVQRDEFKGGYLEKRLPVITYCIYTYILTAESVLMYPLEGTVEQCLIVPHYPRSCCLTKPTLLVLHICMNCDIA